MALAKAVIVNLDARVPVPIPVLFNPPDYELSKTNQYAELKVPGLSSPVLQYVGGGVQSLSMEFFFDTTDSGIDVRLRTNLLANLAEPDSRTNATAFIITLGVTCFPMCLNQYQATL